MGNNEILKFIFELGHLRRIKHEGWRLINVDNPESVADHSLRAAQIGFVLAKMENYENPQEVCTMVVFHDMGECRVGDIHKVANRYIESDEELAVKEQLQNLGNMGNDIFDLWKHVEYKDNKAGIIAKDADLLETAITGKEYLEKGFVSAQDWITNTIKRLQTNSAKELIELLNKSSSNDWWQGLKKL